MSPSRRITYTGGHLDRAGMRRKDAAWLATTLARDDAQVIPVSQDRCFVIDADDGPRAGRVSPASLATLGVDPTELTLLGLDGLEPVFAADLSDAAAERLTGGTLVDLRRVGGLLSASDAALLAYARGIVGWHRRHRHCGVCGSATERRHAGHMRQCVSAACGAEVYPRTDPAVIMLVEGRAPDGEPVCLLGRHGRLPPGAFSTLAGFVEPGESLEEAVAREVLEETGVRASSAAYHASQPWPFPASLMIGFRARAESSEITVDPEELEEARWFTAAELRAAGEWGDASAGLKLPRHDSIARALVETWLAEQALDA